MKGTTNMKLPNKNQLIFTAVFTVFGLLALQVPLTHLLGSKVTFTLFDSFGPIAGGFLGTLPGLISVALMQVLNFAIHGAKVADAGTIIRFFPMLVAVIYFSRKTKANLLIPALAILAFIFHPVGRTVWFYSLYWLIPIVCYFFQNQSLLARALGATFTAHAVGGALWIYFFPLPATVWINLIPIVALERILFTAGIAASYLAFNNLFAIANQWHKIPFRLPTNPQYLWKGLQN